MPPHDAHPSFVTAGTYVVPTVLSGVSMRTSTVVTKWLDTAPVVPEIMTLVRGTVWPGCGVWIWIKSMEVGGGTLGGGGGGMTGGAGGGLPDGGGLGGGLSPAAGLLNKYAIATTAMPPPARRGSKRSSKLLFFFEDPEDDEEIMVYSLGKGYLGYKHSSISVV